MPERHGLIGALLIAAVAIVGWQLVITSAVDTTGGLAVDCSAATPGIQTDCSYPTGATFRIEVHVTKPPAGGYFAHQVKLRWKGAVQYLPSLTAADENLWPACTISGRADNWKTEPLAPSLLFACVPFPLLIQGDTATGAILRFQFQCQQDGMAPLTLVPRPGDVQLGTHFLDAMIHPIDPLLANATVSCGATPTPTATPPAPTENATPTSTTQPPTLTPTAQPTSTPALGQATPTPTLSPAAGTHDVAIMDRDRRQPGIQIEGWTGALRAPLDSPAGSTKRVTVTVENYSDHGDAMRVQLSVQGLPGGCFVDGNGDNAPDVNADEQQVALDPGARAALTFAVTVECHAPSRVGDTFRVSLLAQVEHLGGSEAAGALLDNSGSATAEVRVVR